MNENIVVDQVWWRNVQRGEFYNIEREPKIEGGGGSLYIEIPGSLVSDTLQFLDCDEEQLNSGEPIVINARVLSDPSVSAPLEFRTKKGGRMRIARQNRKQSGASRHPAWTKKYSFPAAPDNLPLDRTDFDTYFPSGGLRIFIVKSTAGEFYAGFTKGPRLPDIVKGNPNYDLYSSDTSTPGGIIRANGR